MLPTPLLELVHSNSRWTMLLYDPSAPNDQINFGDLVVLSSPRSFGVLNHNMDPKKGGLFLKTVWEPRMGRQFWAAFPSAPELLVLTASPTPAAWNGMEIMWGIRRMGLQFRNHLFWPS